MLGYVKVIKEAKGVMCERRACCANCEWFQGSRPGPDVDESYYYRYKGNCRARYDLPTVSGDGYCGEYDRY